MSGRHRRTATTQRALVAGVPALGLVGAVVALGGGAPGATSDAAAGGPTPTAAEPAEPVAGAVAPQATPAVTTVAADAAAAADRSGERQRVQESRELDAVVDDVRSADRDRRATAAARGREQLERFHDDLAQRSDPASPDTGPVEPRSDDGRSSLDGSSDACDTTAFPTAGESADPDEIVGRDCGLVDVFGRQRSADPWIDGQLLSSGGLLQNGQSEGGTDGGGLLR